MAYRFLRSREAMYYFLERNVVSTFPPALRDTQCRNLGIGKSYKDQYYVVAGFPQLQYQVSFGLDGAVGSLLPMGKNRLGCERHLVCHHQANNRSDGSLGQELPSQVVVAKLLCPLWELTALRVSFRKNRGRKSVGIYKRNLEPRRQSLIPKRRLTRPVMTCKHKGYWFARACKRLIEQAEQVRWFSASACTQRTLKRPPAKRPTERLPSRAMRRIWEGSSGSTE